MPKRLGVGIIGSGPVTQAIHLPALAWVRDLFEVEQVMDANLDVARAVADRVGARATTSVSEVLDDPAVEVVAVCSPHRFHAEQTIAACRAGKKAVLCEKPVTLAVEQAEEVARVSRETGVPVIVGTMHTFDSGWTRARAAWGETAGSVHAIRSSIVLPPNPRMEDFATEVVGRPELVEPDFAGAEVRARIVYDGLMGVAIHNIPHVRSFLPPDQPVEIRDVRCLPPFGYQVLATAGDCKIEWHCRMYDTWRPNWAFDAVARDRALHIDFTPSYVQAGSATASIATPGRLTTFAPSVDNGYVEEWRVIAGLAHGALPAPDLSIIVDDLRLALQVADSAAEFVRTEATR
ncbi:MAG: Gfo/Idh/MocA family oxidoreductase [Propionicimonas sp.]